MIAHARAEFPNEACGLLATSGDRVVRVYLLRNAEASPVHYKIDAGEQLRVMLEIEDSGWEMGAIWHSHTHTRAYPSATDIRLAFFPDAFYIIVSLADDDKPDVRAFQIIDGAVEERTLEIAET